MGVFRHRDGEWAVFGEGLPNVIVGDLVFHVPTRLLRAGTRSRGVWEIAVPVAATGQGDAPGDAARDAARISKARARAARRRER